MTPPPEVSPAPWPLVLVMLTGVFSATAWGLGTLFRPRPRFAAADPEEDDDDDTPAAGAEGAGSDRGGDGDPPRP